MDIIILCVTITALSLFGIFGLGVWIGEGIYKRQYVRNNSGDILPCNDSDLSDNNMGDNNTTINNRQDMGMGTEEIIEVLHTMKIGTSRTERKVLDTCIGLIEKLQEILKDDIK